MNSRKKLLLGNWKMHKSAQEVVLYANTINAELAQTSLHCVLGFAPGYLHLHLLKKNLQNHNLIVAAQDAYPIDQGAFTAAVSAKQLADDGICYTLIGHSERRTIFHDNNEIIAAKVSAALKHNLTVIFCYGETLNEYETKQTESVLSVQLQAGLAHLPTNSMQNIILAYEPVWAIGTGKTATLQQAQANIAFSRKWIKKQFGEVISQKIQILYGGSVNLQNVVELINQPDIDGALVGGASLKPVDFVNMAKLIK